MPDVSMGPDRGPDQLQENPRPRTDGAPLPSLILEATSYDAPTSPRTWEVVRESTRALVATSLSPNDWLLTPVRCIEVVVPQSAASIQYCVLHDGQIDIVGRSTDLASFTVGFSGFGVPRLPVSAVSRMEAAQSVGFTGDDSTDTWTLYTGALPSLGSTPSGSVVATSRVPRLWTIRKFHGIEVVAPVGTPGGKYLLRFGSPSLAARIDLLPSDQPLKSSGFQSTSGWSAAPLLVDSDHTTTGYLGS